MSKKFFYSVVVVVSMLIFSGCASTAYLVQIEAGQGEAAPGNTKSANFLAVVTESHTGAAVTSLNQSNFTIINHFSIPGQKCGFSNNITTFNNVGTGAYHIQVGLQTDIPGCEWVKGKYLAQVMVSSDKNKGQGTATLSIK
jgi:hypothetical protein